MSETIIVPSWMNRFTGATMATMATTAIVIVLVAAVSLADAQGASRKPPAKAQPAKAQPAMKSAAQLAPSITLAPAPPAGADLNARMTWLNQEADRQRALIGKAPQDEQLRLNIAVLAVQATRDFEDAQAIGDASTSTALRQLIEKKMADSRWRLNWMSQHNLNGADFALGVLSQQGILEDKNAVVARQRFEQAWSRGFLDAAYRLAGCYRDKQAGQADALLRMAADAGHAAASEQVGRGCLESKPSDSKCALRYLSASASSGRASAKSLLGWMHAQGAGVERDAFLAEKLYLEAAAAGDQSARNNLGELYETGRGVKEDAARAFENYRQAAEAGFVPAQFNLGRMYAAGTGTERDFVKSRLWLGRALQGGVQPAKQMLDWLDKQEPGASK